MAIDLSAVSGMTPSGLAVPGYIEDEIRLSRTLRSEQEMVAAAVKEVTAAAGANMAAFAKVGEAVSGVSKDIASLVSVMQASFGSATKDAGALASSLQAVAGSAPKDVSALNAGLADSSAKAKAATTDFLGLGQAFGSLKGHIANNIGDWALQGVEKLVDVQREFDKLNTTMVAATGSSANAAREFQWLRQFAMDTPVSLAEVTQGFVKMKAAGLDPTQEAMTSFSNTATAMGTDFGKMIDAVTDASDGKFDGLEQLGISAKKEGENVALTFQGVTTTVKNNSEEIVGYIEKIGNTTFDGATAKHAQTLDGALSKLGNTWDELFRSISEGDAGSLIFDTVTLATGAIRDAITIVRSMTGAMDDNARSTGALATLQKGIGLVFEGVAIGAATLKHVLVQVGTQIGGMAAIAVQLATFNWSAAAEISKQVKIDSDAAAKDLVETIGRITSARQKAQEAPAPAQKPAPDTVSPKATSGPASVSEAATPPAGGKPTPATPSAVRSAVCCCDDKSGKTPAAPAVSMQQSQSQSQQQQQEAKAAAAAAATVSGSARATGKTPTKEAVVAAASSSSSSSSSSSLVIPAAKGAAPPPNNAEQVVSDYAKATEEIRKQTAELIKQRETLQASINTLGMSEIAIAKLNVEETKKRIDAAVRPGSGSVDNQPDRVKALQELLEEQKKTAAAKEEADYSKRSYALKEQIEQSRESNALVKQEISLTGLSQLERSKIAALRTIEVRQAKELKEIEKSGHTAPRTKELSDQVREKSRIDAETEVQKLVQADWQKTADQINGSLTDAFMKSLESGKDFGKNLRNALKEQFKSLVLKPTISAIMGPISGGLSSIVTGIMGGGGNPLTAQGRGSGGLLGVASNANSLYTAYGAASQYLFGGTAGASTASLAYANAVNAVGGDGLGALISGNGGWAGVEVAANPAFEAAIAAQEAAQASAIAAEASATAAGSSAAGASAWGAAGWGSAIFALFVNLIGGFKTDTQIGSGLTGKLDGRSTLTPWQEWREGGSFLSGPSFETHNPLERIQDFYDLMHEEMAKEGGGDAGEVANYQAIINRLERDSKGLAEATVEQSKMIQSGYALLRTGVVDMANSLGIAGDSVADFVYELDQQDLNFQGLKPEEIQKKISDLYAKAGDTLTQQFLGAFVDVPKTVAEVVGTVHGGGQDQWTTYERQVRETSERTYQPSEFAKKGETAYQTLTRLAASFYTLNEASDALGFGIHQGSLMLADFADDFIEAFGGLERFKASTGAFLQNYYSDEERREYIASSGSRRLEKLGINVSAEQLLDATGSDIRNAVNSVVSNPDLYGDAMDIANYLAPLYQRAAQAAPAVEDLSNAVDELTQKFNGAKDALLNDAKSLSVDLLRAQGKEGEAKALERTNYLAGFSDLDETRRQELATLYDINTATRRAIEVQNERNGLQGELNSLTDTAAQALTRQRNALDESNRALFDNVQAVKPQKTIAEELPGVVGKYMSPAQRQQSQYDKVTADLNAAGLKVSADQLMGLSKAQIGVAAVAIYNLAGVSDEARLAIVRAAGALADLKDADVDNAFAALERAVDAQRTVLNEAIAELTTVFETARDAAKSLFGEVESAVQFKGDEGRAFISNALSVARTTGYLPDSKAFSKAVGDATGALGQQMFATQAESDYQRLVLANELQGLQDISGDQLEKTKNQLDTLEAQLKVQRQSVEALGGIDASVISVEQAIERLAAAMNGAQAAPRTPTTTTLKGSGGASYDLSTGTGQTSSGVAFSGSAIKEAALKAISEGASQQEIYNIIRDSGFTMAQAEQMAGSAPGSLQKLEADMGWAAAYGGTGSFYKQSALVEPTAYDPTAAGNANQQIVSALQDVRSELIEVRKQNDELQYAASRTADAVNGRPEAPMLVENV